MNRTFLFLVAGLAIILFIVLGVVFFLSLSDILADEAVVGPSNTPTALAIAPSETATQEATRLPPVVVIEPTFTPLSTNTPITPSSTPRTTDTPAPTNTPLILPTNTPIPTPIPPTNTAAPPTNTAVPPTNTPVVIPTADARGLVATHFALQDRSIFVAGQPVWFEFTVSNTTGGDVPYNRLGVLPRKGGVDRYDWFQQSWGGTEVMPPGGLTWEDHIRLPETGSYTLRLAICFDGYEACRSGGGSWVTLSQEIPVNIN